MEGLRVNHVDTVDGEDKRYDMKSMIPVMSN
jgi:hypothetical protein